MDKKMGAEVEGDTLGDEFKDISSRLLVVTTSKVSP